LAQLELRARLAGESGEGILERLASLEHEVMTLRERVATLEHQVAPKETRDDKQKNARRPRSDSSSGLA
jgi:hypothetical protein